VAITDRTYRKQGRPLPSSHTHAQPLQRGYQPQEIRQAILRYQRELELPGLAHALGAQHTLAKDDRRQLEPRHYSCFAREGAVEDGRIHAKPEATGSNDQMTFPVASFGGTVTGWMSRELRGRGIRA